jgi:hypothetical protein
VFGALDEQRHQPGRERRGAVPVERRKACGTPL